MANDLTEKQLTFVVWAAQPDGVRQPDTDREWGELFGIPRTTMWRWRKDPRVAQAIRYIVIQQAGNPLNVGRVLDMVLERAMSGDPKDHQYALKAAELWMKAVGVTGQNNTSNSILQALDEEDSFADFSTEELERLKAEAEAGRSEQAKIDVAKVKLASVGVE